VTEQRRAMMTREMAAELQAAINLGNVEQSQVIARQLAESKAKIIVRMDEDSDAGLTPDASDVIRYACLQLSLKLLKISCIS